MGIPGLRRYHVRHAYDRPGKNAVPADQRAQDSDEAHMPVMISMLRGVNVGPHNRIKMDALREMYESLKLEDPRTYVQSGNVIFRTNEKDLVKLASKIQKAIEKTFGCCPAVVLRTRGELKKVIVANPFAGRDLHPGK